MRSTFVETLQALAAALLVALVIRTVLIQAYEIPSGSMKPSLLPGDRILVWKIPYGVILPLTSVKIGGWRVPQRGEVLVFQYPENPHEDFVKRVVGLPGDVVEVRGGIVLINGTPLARAPDGVVRQDPRAAGKGAQFLRFQETIGGIVHPTLYAADGPGARREMAPTAVPPHKYFFLGDNRDQSLDSRAWGFVDYSQIRGKALFVYLSLGEEGQWRRIGQPVK